MRTMEIKVYQYEELSDKAKQKAREWFARACEGDEWWDFTKEDAKNIGINITSFDTYRQTINGEIITSATQVIEEIIKNHGEQCDTYKTAKRYEPTFKKLEEMRDSDDPKFDDEWENSEHEFLHDILEDYLLILKKEYEYHQSDEYLEEGILANEYEFYEDGRRARP